MSCDPTKLDYAGEDLLTFRTTITPGTTAFTTKDIIGSLYEIQNAVSENGGSCQIVDAVVIEKSGTPANIQNPALLLNFFNASSTPPANNAAFTLATFATPAYDGNYIAGEPVGGTISYWDIDTVWSVGRWITVGSRLRASAVTRSLWVAVQILATATFTTGSTLELVLTIRRD